MHRWARTGVRADWGEGDFGVGRKPGADQRALHAERSGAGLARRTGADANALRAGHHSGRLRGAAIQRNTEQDLRDFWQKRGKKLPDKETNMERDIVAGSDSTMDPKNMPSDSGSNEAETA